jgi:hypothetical protein
LKYAEDTIAAMARFVLDALRNGSPIDQMNANLFFAQVGMRTGKSPHDVLVMTQAFAGESKVAT